MAFLAGVKILPDRIAAGVPVADSAGKVVANRIVGEGEGIGYGDDVGQVHHAVHAVIGAVEDRGLEMVTGENLRRREHHVVPLLAPLGQISVNLTEVLLWAPRVRIHNGYHDISLHNQKALDVLLQMFHAP